MRTTTVREARVTGRLEHPGIVPVHALGRDEDGEIVCFPDVASPRRELASFVVHRDALEITARPTAQLDAVETGEVEDARGELAEARSGFRQAPALWKGSPKALTGLARCPAWPSASTRRRLRGDHRKRRRRARRAADVVRSKPQSAVRLIPSWTLDIRAIGGEKA